MAVVQTKIASSGASAVASLGAAFASNNTAGNFLVVVADIEWGGSTPAMSISDTLGNTWIQLFETNPDVSDTAVWYCWNCKGGANTVTITSSVGNVNIGIIAREYSGVQNTSDPLDKKVNANGSSTALSSGATAVTANANDLVIGIGTSEHPNTTFTAGSGFGNLTVQNDINLPHEALAIEDMTVSATGAQTATFTQGSSSFWVAGVAVFKLAASAVPSPPVRTRIANKFVGPSALRQRFITPYYPVVPTFIPNYPDVSIGMNVGNDQLNGASWNATENDADLLVLTSKLRRKRVRIALPSYSDAPGISNMRQMALNYKANGYFVSYGVTGNGATQNATTYAAWKAQVPTEAAWASANRIDRFYIGNEEDWQAQIGSFGTVTDATVRTDVLALATTLKASYPNMEIVYSTAQGTVTQWNAAGTGSLDKLGFNMYDTLQNFGPNITFFMSQIGVKYFVSEWNSNFGYWDMTHNFGYSDVQYANDLASRYATLQANNLEAYFFAYRYGDNTVGSGNYNIVDNNNLPVPGYEQAFGAPALPYPPINPTRIANRRVGPMALRRQFRQPYMPQMAVSSNIIQTIAPTGIASTAILAAPALASVYRITPAAIASTASLGSPTVKGKNTIAPSGIASTLAIGSIAIQSTDHVAVAGIVSAAALGAPTLTPGPVSRTITGIGSGAALGSPVVKSIDHIAPSGIASTLGIGSPTVKSHNTITPSGIASGSAVGAPTVRLAAQPITPAGIASTAQVGSPSVRPGAISRTMTGIASALGIGSPAVKGRNTIQMSGIAGNSSFGTPALSSRIHISATAIPSAAVIGVPRMVYRQIITPVGIAGTAKLGAASAAVLWPEGNGTGSAVWLPGNDPASAIEGAGNAVPSVAWTPGSHE